LPATPVAERRRLTPYLGFACALHALPMLPSLLPPRAGSDDAAQTLALQLQPGFTPAAERLVAPPTARRERQLFAIQTALGAGGFFAVTAVWRRRRMVRNA